ncbi:MAG: futalosine hydrolase [Sediminibacterium sp.]|nr:futalosine hydrolase [Sediminibacterium sp.]TXT34903.1 MAG: futalosine nucleosidase [Chitinophagaceae bacterium]
MKVVITAATVGEWMPAFASINNLYTEKSSRFKVQFYQSGVGMLASSVALTRLAIEDKPDLIIQIGIAGSFKQSTQLGKVVVIDEEILGDTGVEENGAWKDIFDLKLEKSNYHPFEKRKLPNPWLKKFNLLKLPELNAITVNQISTDAKRIKQLQKKYKPDVESMEGAALHYIGREMGIPFIQIRAISNLVGERDKSKWLLKASIDNLNKTVLQYIDALYKIK